MDAVRTRVSPHKTFLTVKINYSVLLDNVAAQPQKPGLSLGSIPFWELTHLGGLQVRRDA
jgi:hypothetical protein